MLVSKQMIIVGSGISGLVLALELAQAGFSLALLDSREENQPSENPIRVSALNLHTRSVLEKLGIWSNIPFSQIGQVEKMQVWDSKGHGQIRFSQPVEKEPLAFIVPNILLRNALLSAIGQFPHITYTPSVKGEKLVVTAQDIRLLTQQGEQYSGELLIGADGANSWVRSASSIAVWRKPYGQKALIGWLDTEKAHDNTAYQVFLPTGPLAFLPDALPHRGSFVWSIDNHQADRFLYLEESAFSAEISRLLSPYLGQVTLHSERAAFALNRQQAHHYIQERLALIGDAAHTLHPLAGQGLNLGIADADYLAQLLIKARNGDKPFSDRALLKKYQCRRKAVNLSMLLGIEAFHKTFTSQRSWISRARSAALNQANQFSFLKQLFIKQANGFFL